MSKGTDITIEEARELVADRGLWPLARDFFWDFAPQIHPSWLLGIEGFGKCDADLTSSPRVKRYVLDALGVEPCFQMLPKGDVARLLLQNGTTLESLAKWFGALAFADGLRRVTNGATVRELKAALPGIYPEVFGYTAYFAELTSPLEGEMPSAQGIVEEGVQMLFGLFEGLPDVILRRLELKLPMSFDGLRHSPPRRGIKMSAVVKLLKLKFPEAYSTCC